MCVSDDFIQFIQWHCCSFNYTLVTLLKPEKKLVAFCVLSRNNAFSAHKERVLAKTVYMNKVVFLVTHSSFCCLLMDQICYSARKIPKYLDIFCLFWAHFVSYKTVCMYGNWTSMCNLNKNFLGELMPLYTQM